MTDRLVLRRPDDWHVHLRDGAMLAAVLPFTARQMGRAIAMPNLKPPCVTTAQVAAYRDRILAALPAGSTFQPWMTAYLTDDTDPDDLERGARDGVIRAVKLYPAGATTNSASGVTRIEAVERVLARMEAIGLPLLVHAEVTDPAVDVFDREAVYLDRILGPALNRHAGLRCVVEHATTREAVDFVRAHGSRVGCTITPQHLLANRNDLLVGGIRPHFYCLPVLKRASHQEALLEAATSGEPRFFLGTDSAPHPVGDKETACGCAGCFSAPTAIELYAEAFDRMGKLDRLEGFASVNGARFYGVEPNSDTIELVRETWRVPDRVGEVVPFWAGRELSWALQAQRHEGTKTRRAAS